MSSANKRKIDNNDNNKRIKNQAFTKRDIKSFLKEMNITENNNFNIDIFIDSVLNSGILDDYSIHNKAELFNLLRYLCDKKIKDINTLEILVNIKDKMKDPFSLIIFILNIEIKNLTDINNFLIEVYNSKILNKYSDWEKILLIQLLSKKGIDNISTLKGFTNILLIIDNKSKLIDFLNNIKTENLTNNLTNFYQFIKKVIESQILNQYSDDEKITMIKLLSEKRIDDEYSFMALNNIKNGMNNKSKLIDFLNNIKVENLTNINEFIKRVSSSKILDGHSDDKKITMIKLLSEKGIDNINFLINLKNKSFENIIEDIKSYLSIHSIREISNKEIFQLETFKYFNLNKKDFKIN